MKNVVGIRRENVDATERRAPLSPGQVGELVSRHGLRVMVEPSDRRIFTNEAYADAGAEISGDLGECNAVFGVKEIPVTDIRAEGAYCYFSHTIKAQRYNMPMLAHIIDVQATLLDYELVTNESGRRIIFFGDYAGYAGMLDTLWALGRRLELEGIATPFANLKRAREYESLSEAEAAVEAAGAQIRAEGLPEALTPMIFAITGRGHVARGAQQVLSRLPLVRVLPEDIDSLASGEGASDHAIYAAEFKRPDLYAPLNPEQPFDPTEFEEDPGSYRGRLEDYVDHLTVIVNGIYWEPKFPRLLTRKLFREKWARSGRRLRLVADITCDIEGSVEFTLKPTTSDNPVFVYEPAKDDIVDGLEGDGPVVLAVDKLPAELPRESTESFGRSLIRFVPELARADFTRPADEIGLPDPFRRALIVHRGRLTENFRYLNSYVLRNEP